MIRSNENMYKQARTAAVKRLEELVTNRNALQNALRNSVSGVDKATAAALNKVNGNIDLLTQTINQIKKNGGGDFNRAYGQAKSYMKLQNALHEREKALDLLNETGDPVYKKLVRSMGNRVDSLKRQISHQEGGQAMGEYGVVPIHAKVNERGEYIPIPPESKVKGDVVYIDQNNQILPSDPAARFASLVDNKFNLLDKQQLDVPDILMQGRPMGAVRESMTPEQLLSHSLGPQDGSEFIRGINTAKNKHADRLADVGIKLNNGKRQLLDNSNETVKDGVPFLRHGNFTVPIIRNSKFNLLSSDNGSFFHVDGDRPYIHVVEHPGALRRMVFASERSNPTINHEEGHARLLGATQDERNRIARRFVLGQRKAFRNGYNSPVTMAKQAPAISDRQGYDDFSMPANASKNTRPSARAEDLIRYNPVYASEGQATQAGLQYAAKERNQPVKRSLAGWLNTTKAHRNASPLEKATLEQLYYNYQYGMKPWHPTMYNAVNNGKKAINFIKKHPVAPGILTNYALYDTFKDDLNPMFDEYIVQPVKKMFPWGTGQQNKTNITAN